MGYRDSIGYWMNNWYPVFSQSMELFTQFGYAVGKSTQGGYENEPD